MDEVLHDGSDYVGRARSLGAGSRRGGGRDRAKPRITGTIVSALIDNGLFRSKTALRK